MNRQRDRYHGVYNVYFHSFFDKNALFGCSEEP